MSTLNLQLVSFGQLNLDSYQEGDKLELKVSINEIDQKIEVDPMHFFDEANKYDV
jgi:hypothetical protein